MSIDGSNHFIFRDDRECVDRIHRKSQVAMTLTPIDGGWAHQRGTEFARRGPWGGLLCAVWKLNKTTEAGSQGSNTPMGPWPGEFLSILLS